MKLTITNRSGIDFNADVDQAHGVVVKSASFDDWVCRWFRPVNRDSRQHCLGVHAWFRGADTAEPPGYMMLSNAAWAPGLNLPRSADIESIEYGDVVEGPGEFPLRFHMVRYDGLAPLKVNALGSVEAQTGFFHGISNPYEAGEQGGQGIWLHPGSRATAWRADRIADRNPVAAFHAATGECLTRRELGGEPYELLRSHVGAPVDKQQLAVFGGCDDPFPFDAELGNSPDSGELATWTAIDGPHLCRAFMDDLGVWRSTKSPVSRWRLMMLAQDAMNAFPLIQLPNGAQSLGQMLINVRASPGLAKIGVIRQLAWVGRAVCAAREAHGKPHREMDLWLRAFVQMVCISQAPSGVFADHVIGDQLDQGEPWREGLPQAFGECPIWQQHFLVRALYEAQRLIGEDGPTIAVLTAVQRYLRLWKTVPLVPDEFVAGATGLPRYLVTSVNGVLLPTVTVGAWPTSRAEAEPDVFAVAVRLGILPKLPAKYARPGELEYVADAQEVAKAYGVGA